MTLIKNKNEIISSLESYLKEQLDIETIDKNVNLKELGITSIKVMKVASKLKKNGLNINFGKLMGNPTLAHWEQLITDNNFVQKESFYINENNQNEEFPLTDVQYSYFIGREDEQTLGGVSCHPYIEIDGENIDEVKLENAWNKLQYRHPMLRARFTEDGKQEILDKPFSEEIEVFDLSNLDDEENKIRLDEIRENLSHRKLRVEMGEVAGLKLANLSQNKNKIFFDLDLLVADVMSLSLILKELGELYLGKELDNLNNYTFKDYINNLEVDSEIYKKDQEFWKEKIDSFEIERPNLPLKKAPEQIKETRFTRRKRVIEKDKWSKIQELAASYKSTPSMVLLTAYALILERWTNQDKFFINLPLFNRDLSNENLKDMVADFTNILLVEHERKNDTSFLETLNRISETFIDNASHSSYSGVQVQRDISKSQGTSLNVSPVVFACNIDYPLETEISRKALGKITYMVSQTPGVWLDFQSYIKDGDLVLCWDSVDELFPEKMLDDMLNSLEEQLLRLTEKENWESKFDVLSENQKLAREKELKSILPLNFPDERLYDGFIKNVKENPEKIAIIDSETKEEISYMDLYEKSLKIAGYLKENGIKKGEYVGITLLRSSKQIYAIFGILFAGAAYVAIGINQPSERRSKIYEQIGIKFVISDNKTIEDYKLDTGEVSLIDLDKAIDKSLGLDNPIEVSPFDSAYIIMTSGTTGVPKGVEIMHTSAINTINDLNEKYSINSNDTLLMVSAIDFDLSVYDIFGILGIGGTLITTNEDNYRNPDEWIRIIEKYNVSVWDSVPILFDMLVTMAEGEKKNLPLRIVMLSGDWIAKDLPGRFYSISNNNAIVVAMGGATEASIWSNYLNVPRTIPQDWISIPYGKALKNQVYRVVDELGRNCPNHVMGELLIGGVGVAKGYYGDRELTEKKFLKKDGIRWYKTGDNGRTWDDGTIEFLGRKDTQVKIKGHRIELGEIEDAIRKYGGVDNVFVDVFERGNSKNLVAFIKIDESSENFTKKINLEETSVSFVETPKSIPSNDVISQNKSIDKIVMNMVMDILRNIGVDFSNREYYIEDIYKLTDMSELSMFIVKNWMKELLNNNYLKLNDGRYSLAELKRIPEDSDQREITRRINSLKPTLLKILEGEKDPVELLYTEDNQFNLTKLTENLMGYKESIESIISSIKKYKGINSNEKIRVLEYGTRDANLTKKLFENLKDYVSEYVYADNTVYSKAGLSELDDCNKFKYMYIKDLYANKSNENYFDVVITINSIHRNVDVNLFLEKIQSILNPNGILIGHEIQDKNLLHIITADVMNQESFKALNIKQHINPDYKIVYLTNQEDSKNLNFSTFVLQNKRNEKVTFDKLKNHLYKEIPNYMVPTLFYKVFGIPLNKNGKVDRKKLKSNITNDINKTLNASPNEGTQNNEMEGKILEIWKNSLSNEDIVITDNYFSIGGDSLVATSIIGKIRSELGYELSVKDIFENPTVTKLSQLIKNSQTIKKVDINDLDIIISDKENLYETFPLTDVQMAYWIGRQGAYELGDVSTHCYFEFDCENLDIGKLQNVLNDMINYHPALRTVILRSGEQQVIKNPPRVLIEINELTLLNESDREKALMQIRDSLSHRVIDLSKIPTFDFKVAKYCDNKCRICIGIDNTILDGWSMYNFLDEMNARYKGEFVEENIDISFRDYVLYKEQRNKANYARDKTYWQNRIESFPDAPLFNFMQKESNKFIQKFKRKEKTIGKSIWLNIKNIANANNITPTVLILSIFATIINKYSEKSEFTINMTQFSREDMNSKFFKVMGDFTDLNLLEVKLNEDTTIVENARNIQYQFLSDMEHTSYSILEFLRDLRDKKEKCDVARVVFTSGLGINKSRSKDFLGTLNYMLSQTPQIWLDHQIMEIDGNLVLAWDYVGELFDESKIGVCFNDYVKAITEVSINGDMKVKNLYTTITKNNRFENTAKNINGEVCETIFNLKCLDKNKITNEKEAELLSTDLVKIIREIFMEILECNEIESDDNFFSLGGNSLNMIQLSNKLSEEFGYQLNFSDFFEKPTISYIASEVIGNYKR